MTEAARSPDETPRAAPRGDDESRGFCFAATGRVYVTLARRAARTLRRAMPAAQIDLFTDTALDDDVFDRVHRLETSWFRPKMEAMRRSRFVRTVMLDADVIVRADVSELFEILGRYDLAGAHATYRFDRMGMDDPTVPRCLPIINSGVLAVRRSDAMSAFLTAWEQALRNSDYDNDQRFLRHLLYKSDLRFAAIGAEYNLMDMRLLRRWQPKMGAPRILHLAGLHGNPPGNPEEPFDLETAMGARLAGKVRRLHAADPSIGPDPDGVAPPPPPDQGMMRWRSVARRRYADLKRWRMRALEER